MSEKILLKQQLSELLQKNWTSILDRNLFMKRVLLDVQKTELSQTVVQELPPCQVKMTITKFQVTEPDTYAEIADSFNLWVEFSVPRGQGVVVGTHVYRLYLEGSITLKDAYGVFFVPKISVSSTSSLISNDV